MPLRHSSSSRHPWPAAVEDPLVLLRLVVTGLLVLVTVVALVLSITGVAPRAWLVMVGVWAVYGLVHGFTDIILEPLTGFLAFGVSSIGVERIGTGFSEVETLEAQGHLQAAADAYRDRATRAGDRIPATVRRAALLAGPLGNPEQAVAELDALRRVARPLAPADDILVGLALADLQEHRLDSPGRAMAELRRLLDQYPQSHHARRMRATLAVLRERHFGDPVTPEPGA